MGKKKKTIDELLEEALVPEEQQPYEIPDNWVWVKIGYLNSHKKNSITPQNYPDEDFELYSVPSYDEKYPEINQGKDIKSNKYMVAENDILLCKINPRINRVWIVNDYTNHRKIASTEWIVYSTIKINSNYLMWVMRSNYFRILLETNVSGVGGSLTRARPKDVKNYPVPLPPLFEQKRIIEKIESMFAKIDQAKDLIEQSRETFKNRKTAILSEAFRGELTKKWRSENNNLKCVHLLLRDIREKKGEYKKKETDNKDLLFGLPDTWKWVRIGDIADLISGQHIKKKDYNTEGKGIPYLTGPSDFGSINPFVSKWTTNPKITASKDDILITVKGSGVGKVNILHMNDVAISRQLKAIKPVIVNIKYVYHYLESKYDYFQHISTGTAIPGLSIKDILNCYIPLPPLKEQDKIVKIIDELLDKENKILQLISLNKQINNLKKSISSKAFRGELGTNDPNDENSIELLKKVLSKQDK